MTRSLSVLVHGLSKVGKSTLASTCPKPMLYIDVEGGSRFLNIRKIPWQPAIEAPPVCGPESTWDTAVITVRTYAEVSLAYRWLNSGQHCFRSVAIDSATELQQRLIDEVGDRKPMEFKEWGVVFRDFTGLLRDFHQLTEHPTAPMEAVVFVAGSKEAKDGRLKPFAQGQGATTIPYIPDVLACMEVLTYTDPTTGEIQKIHRMTTGPHRGYETGERVGGRIPPVIDSPTVPMLLDYVFGPEPSTVPTVEAQ